MEHSAEKTFFQSSQLELELLAKTKYEHLFGDPIDQLGAANAFQLVLRVRERLLDKILRPAYHGNSSGPTG